MKIIITNLFFLLSFILLGACKKNFLDVPDKTNIVRQSYVTDLKTTGDFLNGIYVEMSINFYRGHSVVYGDLIADDVKPITGSTTLIPHYSWSQKADNSKDLFLSAATVNLNPMWYVGYRIIRDCSFVLGVVDKYRSENPEKADDIKGQAYAIRALVHFTLSNAFSQSYNFTTDATHPGIPYITTSDWTQRVSQGTVKEFYNNLIDDLSNAISFLNNKTVNVLFMNSNAAKALLARVYLFKGDYQAAKNIAREVINKVPLMPAGPNGYPFKLFTDKETEALFQLFPSSTDIGNTYSTFFAGRYYANLYWATNDIANLLNENATDIRKSWISLSSGAWKVVKYPTGVIAGFSIPSASYYHTLFRSSEMYLTASESYSRLNNEDSARFFANAIRQRASVGILSGSVTGATLLDSILKERHKELSFEGFRMYDLLRWKKAVSRQDVAASTPKDLPYPSNKAIAPIPESDVNLSGLIQNLDY